jgi:Lrp/AsnC family transcriptional regulator, regulator for asnA, asnC and gidA
VGIKAHPDAAETVKEILSQIPEIYWLASMTGWCDIFVQASLRRSEEILDLVARRISRIPGVLAAETLVGTCQTWWRPFEWRPPREGTAGAETEPWDGMRRRGEGSGWWEKVTGSSGPQGPVELDEIDTRIIALLQENGRRPATEMARALSVSQWTVKSRIDKLLDSGVCEVVGVVDPEKLGFSVEALVGIKTEPAQTLQVGEALALLPRVFWMAHVTGRYDFLVQAQLRDAAEIVNLVSQQLGRIPGVRSTETLLTGSQARWRPSEWRLPRNGVAAAAEVAPSAPRREV